MDAAGDGDVLVILDLRADESLYEAGIAREVINRVQKLRKKAGLEPTDFVEFFYESLDEDKIALENIVKSQDQYIRNTLGSPLLHHTMISKDAVIFCREEVHGVSGFSFAITITKPTLMFLLEDIVKLFSGNNKFAEALCTYLLSRDHSKLRSEFQAGKGKVYMILFTYSIYYYDESSFDFDSEKSWTKRF
ncbi:isoleucine--tRNA ligase, cytoplasmic-like [Phalaenopsis equestris]|uniref:isoleucine--tRNA ligase, cytoplasmic-like n=1 Tax=Phalaenopsis equestris TaxID=78828 RepID=UPI0009E28818|nr:isoleucine--tRNA ligase, cytoplasmic-like [Phalaenopsis equestris]